MRPCDSESLNSLMHDLRASLEQRHGPLLGGVELRRCLGLPSSAALRQAKRRGQLAVALFTLPKRRGHFALTRDVADWIARARFAAEPDRPPEKGGKTL